MSISGFVQAGGASRRMGEPKAVMRLGARMLIEYPLAALAAVAPECAIITNTPELFRDLAVKCYPDRWPGLGPLAGIGAALTHASYDYLLVLACDMPFVSAPLLELLIEQGADHQICVPTDITGQLQPLCARYHKSCLPLIERLIAAGQYAPRTLFSQADTRILDFAALAALPDADILFENVNTAQDFARAATRLEHKNPHIS
jgi:molybdenum cofactor guanylyltransferase